LGLPLACFPVALAEGIAQSEEALQRPPSPQTLAPPRRRALKAAPPLPLRPAPLPTPLPSASPEQCGYRPDTGQILDPVAYALWQKAEAQRRQDELQKQPTVSVTEAFLKAQRALQEWVDADANKPLVAKGDLEAIRQCAAVQELLRRYESYGPVMQEKLWSKLALLVDNRQRFFKGFA